MRIRKIELLSDYKCYKKGTIFNFHDSSIICIIGKNSTGKTIFLEILNNIFNKIKNFNQIMSGVQNFDWEIEVKYKNKINTISRNNVSIFNDDILNLNNNVLYVNDRYIRYDTPIFHKVLRILNLSKNNESFSYKRGDLTFKRGDLTLDFCSLSAGERNVIEVFSLFQKKGSIFTGKEYLYLLDEPDRYLNNELKRKYISLLEEAISKNDQIIFTTHSTELISDLKEIQVYKCENFEIKNINFNPFGQDNSVLTEKLFDDKFSISDIAKNTYDNYREKIKSASIDELYQLRNEIKSIFSDNIYRNELLELINTYLR